MIPKLLPTLNCRLDQSHLLQLCQISPQYQDLYHCRLHQLLSENILNSNYTKSHKSAKIFENFRSKKSYNLKEDLHYLANNDFFRKIFATFLSKTFGTNRSLSQFGILHFLPDEILQVHINDTFFWTSAHFGESKSGGALLLSV